MKKYFSTITKFNYDLFVIGGGSGGIAAVNQASIYKKKVGLCDFVDPSPIGTKWGLGGTCVNVGCIPKKLFHAAALKIEDLETYKYLGLDLKYDHENVTKKSFNIFENDSKRDNSSNIDIESSENKTFCKPKLDWNKLSSTIQLYVKKQNFGNRSTLRKNNVDYFNKKARFIDNHTIELSDNKGKEIITADKILIAVGGRPSYGNFVGNKSVITSDDIFTLKKEPGKTLIIGGSYIALETAGFLNGLGYDTTVMFRSILLRGFDQDISNKIGSYMYDKGVRFIPETIPESIEKINDKIVVSYKNKREEFDTVLLAIGREAVTEYLNLNSIGVNVNKKNNKIIVADDESTNISNIYAIGDCADNRPELTPPAIKAGRFLANRLYNNDKKIMNYKNIATTVFTPIEYGCIGYNEEEALKQFKEISIYHSEFTPLEWNLNLENTNSSYCKIICNDEEKGKIVGMHVLSPNAGEIIQGFSSAFNLGLTKETLNETIAIHPTIAEEITLINKNKKDHDGKKDGC